MKIKFKNLTKKELILYTLFLLSFIHPVSIILFLSYLVLCSLNSIEYGIKSLLLIAIRTILNTSIAVDISSVQIVKYLSIFAISTVIIINSRNYKYNFKIKHFIYLDILFCFYILWQSIFFSSYPIVSIFKCFSYAYVFISVVIGVSCTIYRTNWIDILFNYLEKLMLCSVLSVPFSLAYYSSAHWFKGVTNQSQMFAIMASLYLSLVLLRMIRGDQTVKDNVMIVLAFFLMYLSGSRTGMIASVICLLYAFYVAVFRYKKYYILYFTCLIAIFVWILASDTIIDHFNDFILKTNEVSRDTISYSMIAASRDEQLNMFLDKIHNNKWFGTGFMVPFTGPIIQNWSFSFSLLVENGNIVYSVLGDLGIIGFILFIIVYGYMFLVGKKSRGSILLFVTPFLICFGEMVFFSTNNNAIILYVMLSSYISNCDYHRDI